VRSTSSSSRYIGDARACVRRRCIVAVSVCTNSTRPCLHRAFLCHGIAAGTRRPLYVGRCMRVAHCRETRTSSWLPHRHGSHCLPSKARMATAHNASGRGRHGGGRRAQHAHCAGMHRSRCCNAAAYSCTLQQNYCDRSTFETKCAGRTVPSNFYMVMFDDTSGILLDRNTPVQCNTPVLTWGF
jgi:hypothetical protein